MTTTHSTPARNAATDAVTALLGVSGKLVFRLAGTIGAPGTAVSTLVLSADGFADAVAGIATANSITQDGNATGNAAPVAAASLQTSGGTLVIHCDVTVATGDINLAAGLTILAGDIVTCTSLTYTALPA
jgi:hypothetical protein